MVFARAGHATRGPPPRRTHQQRQDLLRHPAPQGVRERRVLLAPAAARVGGGRGAQQRTRRAVRHDHGAGEEAGERRQARGVHGGDGGYETCGGRRRHRRGAPDGGPRPRVRVHQGDPRSAREGASPVRRPGDGPAGAKGHRGGRRRAHSAQVHAAAAAEGA